jgi:tetratricopeptide (TPR) repeat protein
MPAVPDPEAEGQRSGMGCGMLVLVGVVLGVFGVAIVGLSAGAGWTNGQRAARATAAATLQQGNDAQISAVSNDIAQGNLGLAEARIRYLATNAPSLPQLPALLQTGTALAIQMIPTATATPTITPTATATPTDAATATPSLTPTLSDPFNLADRLNRARSEVALAQWQNAIDELDVILSLDPNYEVVTVRNLMSQALNEQALLLYRTGSLAEAIFLTDRAESFGPLKDGLNYERYVATLYISARSKVGTTDFNGALTALREIYSLAPNYNNGEISQMLYRTYVAYGDALSFSSPCSAVDQYTAALRIFNDSEALNKRITAETTCALGTPTPEGFVPTPSDPFAPTPAPIGQP